MAINLESLSPAELQALIKSAEAQMQSARRNHAQEIRIRIDGLLKSAGPTIDEVYPRRGGQGGKVRRPLLRRSTATRRTPTQTWSGRGKRPFWFSEALKKRGVTTDMLIIGGSATKSAPVKKVASKAPKKASVKKSAHN